MIITPYKLLGFCIAITFLISCKKKDAALVQAQLSVSSAEELFIADGGTAEVAVTSNTKWNISNAEA
jgi:hypothetical protein